MKKYLKYVDNNRGASLVVIMAIFVLILVLCTHMLMAANASNNSLMKELDADAANVYVSSVFECINDAIVMDGGALHGYNIFGNESSIVLKGFQYGDVNLYIRTDGIAIYDIPYTDSANEKYMYEVYAKYDMNETLVYVAEIRGVKDGDHQSKNHDKIVLNVFEEE